MKILKPINNFIIKIIIFISIFNFEFCYANENRIIFKINDDAFTLLDLEKRRKYLEFVSNDNLTNNIIVDDLISVNIFYEFYKNSNQIENLDNKIKEIFTNILEINKKNKKNFNYEIKKKEILHNLKKDFIRKSILENILNENSSDFNISKKEFDLLYNLKLKYINFENINNSKIIKQINSLEKINIDTVELILKENKINYYIKEKEIKDIQKIDREIRKNIIINKKYFLINKNNSVSLFFIEKNFETLEGLVVDLYSVSSKKELNKEILLCKNLINLKNEGSGNKTNIINKEYKLIDLNKELKNNLIDINDYVKFINNDENVYIVLCNIKFDKKLLNDYDLNKQINYNANKIEKEFIKKYSKIYNVIIFYE